MCNNSKQDQRQRLRASNIRIPNITNNERNQDSLLTIASYFPLLSLRYEDELYRNHLNIRTVNITTYLLMLIDLNKLMAVNFILCSERRCRPSCCTALPIFLLTALKASLRMELPTADVTTENVDEDLLSSLPMKSPMPSKLKLLSTDRKQPMPHTARQQCWHRRAT